MSVVALGAYAIGYRRHFLRIAELSEAMSAGAPSHLSTLYRYLDRLVLHTPFQRAGFRFVWKTLWRSEAHRLLLTGTGGLGMVLASQAMMNAVEATKSRQAALSTEALSVPFILSFLIIIGLRAVFELPAELPSNWIFRLMLDPDHQECESLARIVILLAVFPWVLLGVFPLYLRITGLEVALMHTLLVLGWSLLLTNALLIRFRKLPFTCTRPIFQQHSIVVLISIGFGFLLYAASLPEFECYALVHPGRFAAILPAALITWYVPRHLAKSAIAEEKRLIFEDVSATSFELIQLSE